jgi:hypothetical protein
MAVTAEHQRLAECCDSGAAWQRWGPYLSERQWGTVREDYSAGGDAWNYFTHDQARSRAYRWGEDGLGGISDDRQILCFALALWNGQDPILKERLFGLTNSEGNHGEDVKEYYFYLDSTLTHSYMRYLYKYPQAAFPYNRLVQENRRRGRKDFEYELLDTGIFDANRYFDVFVEYAKADSEDVLIRVTAHNRGPEAATLHLLPTLWFRNTWSWPKGTPKPILRAAGARGATMIAAEHPELTRKVLLCERDDLPVLVVENETNERRVFGREGGTPHPKDGINDYVVHGRAEAVNPEQTGTKGAMHWQVTIPPAVRLYCGCGCAMPRVAQHPSAPNSTRALRPAARRRTHSTKRWPLPHSARTRRWSIGRRFPACCGASSTTSTTCGNGRRSAAVHRATPNGRTWTTPTSSPCRTNGNTLGTPPGTSRSTHWRSGWLTLTSLRTSSS